MTDNLESDAIDPALIELLNAHARTIGHLTIMWNAAQHIVFQLFEAASDLSPESAQAVFFAIKSDSGQRDMTLALCQAELAESGPDLLSAIVNAIRRLNHSSSARNAAIHTIWDMSALVGNGSLQPDRRILSHHHHRKLNDDATKQFNLALVEVMKITRGMSESLLIYLKRKTSHYTSLLQNTDQKASLPEDSPTDTHKENQGPPPPFRG